jgi:hypothetical protein
LPCLSISRFVFYSPAEDGVEKCFVNNFDSENPSAGLTTKTSASGQDKAFTIHYLPNACQPGWLCQPVYGAE